MSEDESSLKELVLIAPSEVPTPGTLSPMSRRGPHITIDAVFGLCAEVLFTLFPFIVTVIVLSYKQEAKKLFFMPEWSMAAAVLIGQAIVKNIQGLVSSGRKYRGERIAFVVSMLIVVGLVPSLSILLLALMTDKPSMGLAVAQIILFILALFIFFIFAGKGQTLMTQEEKEKKR